MGIRTSFEVLIGLLLWPFHFLSFDRDEREMVRAHAQRSHTRPPLKIDPFDTPQ